MSSPASPPLEDLLGGVDLASVAAQSATRYKIAYITAGSPADPCAVVPPGSAATKEECLFWGRELASLGPFFVVMYDLRGTGASEPRDRWAEVFEGTSPKREMERVYGIQPKEADVDDDGKMGIGWLIKKNEPAPLDPSISNRLHDTDAYVEDAFSILDELGIQQAHFIGLSQGGNLARIAATRYPERVLSVVACGSLATKLGLMKAMFSAGAEEFHDQMKAAKLFDADGKPPWGGSRRATREEFVPWRSTLLGLIAPGFAQAVYEEMAGKSWDVGYVDENEGGICALAYEAYCRQGKDKEHLEILKNNTTIPIMFVHGKKDAVISVEESQLMFAQTGNCVLELHEHGHNFGPPGHQTALLGRIARFMKTGGRTGAAGDPSSGPAGPSIGIDTYAEGVSPDLQAALSVDTPVPGIWDAFCSVQTAADTSFAFGILLQKLQLNPEEGQGLKLFLELKPLLEKAGLQFKQKKLLTDLNASVLRAQKVVAKVRGVANPDGEAVKRATEESAARSSSGDFVFNEVLVCGAGPVGLRAACELALLGFRVTVIEKRPNFSRANILTFWDETMNDILALGAKSYFPSLQPTGTQKFLGTRQIQVCLLKTLLLLGGTVRYGMEISGLVPPGGGGKWCASFRPYMRQRRAAEVDASAKRSAEQEDAESKDVGEAASAIEFQKAKDYGGKEKANLETWDVDEAYLNGSEAMDGLPAVPFDAYVIAEGGWSDSTKRLGFSKQVDVFKPVFGLVANLKYNPEDLKERNMRSQIHFQLSQNWPLRDCPVQAEFIEYLKGETHFFALVVSKKNVVADNFDERLAKMTPQERANYPDEVIALMRRGSQQKGLLEMGVFRRGYGSGQACMTKDNVDMEKLVETVRAITQEMGLPASTEFFGSNPVQLFDFSRRARCVDPVRVLCAPEGGRPQVLSSAEFLQGGHGGPQALVLPVGDALQEPIWTQGLGINRGFHTAMNQAHACLLARETGARGSANLAGGVRESCAVHEGVCKMKWGTGNSGLAGSGSGSIGLKPFKDWNTDPRSRLPIK